MIHRRVGGTLAILAAFSWTLEPAPAQTSTVEEANIRKVVSAIQDAWNRRDAVAAAAHMVDDADFVNVLGGWDKSRAEHEQGLTQLFKTIPKDQRRFDVEKIRFIRPDVAVVIFKIVAVNGRTENPLARPIYVMSKEGGDWKVNTGHNTRISDR